MAIRVFELARKLGVTSKVILEKCRAEGIELPNHMTALSAGLEATIQEWFSDSSAHTAVETATHVDLEEARRKAAAQRRRRRKTEAAAEAAAEPALAGAVAAPPPEAAAPVAAPEAPPPAAPVEVAPASAFEAPPAPVAAEAPAPVAAPPSPPAAVEPGAKPVAPTAMPAQAAAAAPAPGDQAASPPAKPARAVPHEPPKPKVVMPAGPQVVPKPAKLQGPRVVRFEQVEPDAVARPRRPPGPPPAGGARPPAPAAKKGAAAPAEEEEGKAKKGSAKRRSPRRKSGRTAETGEGLREWRDRDLAERSQRLAAASGGTLRRHRAAVSHGRAEGPAAKSGAIEIDQPITVKSLSAATGLKIADIMRKLMSQGIAVTINSLLDRETTEMIALEQGIELKVKVAKTPEQALEEEFAGRTPVRQEPRAPIVTFLGHVDHGKTSLLDRIRNARVAAGEEGGITQGIGAYRFDRDDRHVVFLDTPGHQAFTAMRSRGANMTDVVVLVVAADDGVMPQTVEALSHAKAAKVPIVVALNKIDLPNANVPKALGQLAEHGLNPREWGGNTEVIRTSAVTGEGIDDLVEVLSLEAELLELKSDSTAPANGWVVEAQLDPNTGTIARLLVKDGTLKVGDVVLAGRAHGRVRSIANDRGRTIDRAGPATPVEITGLDEVPDAGDRFYVVGELGRAKAMAEDRRAQQRVKALSSQPSTTLENLVARIEAGETSEVRLIVKVDVQGSLEALLASLRGLKHEQVNVTVLHSGVGGITEGDVLLAEASQAVIMGFRVVADHRARTLGEQRGVEIRTYRVIYQLLEDVQKVVQGMVAPEMAEKVMGRAEIRQVFKISRVGTVAGCYVLDGVIQRNAKVRLIRDNVIVEDERELESLRRFKDDVRDVRAGLECGLRLAGYDDVKTGDVIEAYQSVAVARK